MIFRCREIFEKRKKLYIYRHIQVLCQA